MSEPPADPWIQFPNLLEDAHPSAAALEQFKDWFGFLLTLSAGELAQRQQEHPAPPGWEGFYAGAERRLALIPNLEALLWPQALIEKMREVTTFR